VRKAVRDHAARNEVHLIVTRAGIRQRIAGVLSGSNSMLDLFNPPSPVLLIHPGITANPAN